MSSSSDEQVIVSGSTALINVNMTNVPKLTTSTFLMWSRQVHSLFDGYDLVGYLDGSTAAPTPTLTTNGAPSPNPAYKLWKRLDKLIYSSLLGAISMSVQPLLSKAVTAHDVWSTLSDTYANPSRTHIQQIRQQVKLWTKGSKSIEEYVQGFTIRFDQLALLGKPIEHEDQIEYILNGLPEDYKQVSAQIEGRDSPPSITEVYEKLINQELNLQALVNTASTLPISANYTNNTNNRNRSSNKPNQQRHNSTNWSNQSNTGLRLFLLLELITLAHSVTTHTQASDGDMVICISKENQPAFDHPLLMYHKIQEAPTEIPRVIGTNKKSEWPTSEAHVSTAKCPQDKVPIQNMTALSHRAKPERGNNNTSVIPKHEHAVALARGIPKVYGTKAVINIWEPVVEDKKIEMSISQIWITSGDFDTNDLNSIEVGWQVDPIVYKDNKPRLFVYWTSDAYRTTGGYNLRKPGFIQTSSEIVLGGSISPVSSFGGSQFEITILVWKDSKSGNWWLSLGPDNVLVGYWPREIFSSLADHGTKVDWGGEIIDSHSFGRHTKTQMGSGRFPEEGFGNASYIRNLEMVDDTNTLQPIEVKRYYSDGPYYSTKKLHTDEWGTHFFFGGPGFTHSGVVPLRLSLYFIYFSFSFFIII